MLTSRVQMRMGQEDGAEQMRISMRRREKLASHHATVEEPTSVQAVPCFPDQVGTS